jgi:molybdopterin biosynthesis enzyme
VVVNFGLICTEPTPQVQVIRKPVVAILSTGNEIVDLQGGPKTSSESWGGIWETNRPSLQTALEGLGYQVVDLGIAHDKFVLNRFTNIPSAFSFRIVSMTTSQRFNRVSIPRI